jgi:hypothetical protein
LRFSFPPSFQGLLPLGPYLLNPPYSPIAVEVMCMIMVMMNDDDDDDLISILFKCVLLSSSKGCTDSVGSEGGPSSPEVEEGKEKKPRETGGPLFLRSLLFLFRLFRPLGFRQKLGDLRIL